ncbi:hypothetical protein DevBK_20730 [Devosia sp. BK]|uniref:hypothetical protein n=1 Tax=Devosia sp. BK TaxID=2871706 RepID=UPI00293A9AF7|nr:hypothetical protein [Devosia sp. BK]MDV3253774.1 hypothetical protein [Devosia sp. BK]
MLVEAKSGMAEALGWKGGERYWRLPRILPIDEFYEVDRRGFVGFAAGIDIQEVMASLYQSEYQYQRRHKQTFANIAPVAGDAYFDVVCGRYPSDEPLSPVHATYRDVFDPEELAATPETALRHFEDPLGGPLWISGHDLDESLGRGLRDDTWFVFDSTDAGDSLDYWNFRLVESRVTPVNVSWIEHYAAAMRERIIAVHRPIPGNAFGTKFRSTICFAASIDEKTVEQICKQYLSDLPEHSFHVSTPARLRRPLPGNRHWGESKIVVSAAAAHFDEELISGKSVRIPSPAPSFLNRTGRHVKAQWINVVSAARSYAAETPATAYPSNLWSPGYPRLGMGGQGRIGREGWILHQEYDIGYSILDLQTGREAIVDWLKTQDILAEPSEEGQIAAQVIRAAGGLNASGMFTDRETVELLGEMAEGHAALSRNGRSVVASTPAKSKHINQIQQHFAAREKRSFGYWNELKYFLERGVFKAGLNVQCPTCGNSNWLDLDSISHRPTCTRCLNSFDFSQAPEHLQKLKWYYRVVGPFAAPDYARGGYSVALTLRVLFGEHDTETTWSTGLKLSPLNCEVDFIGWHRSNRMGNGERDEPLLVFGEAKSFGRNAIDDDAIVALKAVGDRFPGATMVVSVLRKGSELSLAEVGRLRKLAAWGRRSTYLGQPINPLIVLTGTELFTDHGISLAWKEEDGFEAPAYQDFNDLHSLAELTQERYLGLPPHWFEPADRHAPPAMTSIIDILKKRGTIPWLRDG